MLYIFLPLWAIPAVVFLFWLVTRPSKHRPTPVHMHTSCQRCKAPYPCDSPFCNDFVRANGKGFCHKCRDEWNAEVALQQKRAEEWLAAEKARLGIR